MLVSRRNTPESISRLFCATLTWAFRIAIGLNFIHFALSFVPGFESTAGRAGIFDKLFGAYIVGTLRADFAWLLVSTMIIFPATFYFAKVSENDPRARLDVLLGRAWTVAFVVYLFKSVVTGELYPG